LFLIRSISASISFRILCLDEGQKLRFIIFKLVHGILVEETPGARKKDDHLLTERHRCKLRLLEDFNESDAAVELCLRGLVQVGTELGESGQLAVLCKIQLQRSGNLFHGLHLSRATHAGDRKPHIDGRPDAGKEERRLQVDLAVGDRNHVGRNIRGDVAGLCFDDGKRSERSAAQLLAHAGGALQEARMVVEDVSGESLSSRRTPQQQGDLAIGHGLFGKVIVDDQRVLGFVPEVFADAAPGIRRDVL